MKKVLPLCLTALIILSCTTADKSHKDDSPAPAVKASALSREIQPGRWLKNIQVQTAHNSQLSSVRVQIYFPAGYTQGRKYRTIITLHSYDSNEREFENNASLESLANRYNFVIVSPSMGKSVYEASYYPETSHRWNPLPGGKFIGETLLQFLNDNFGLAASRESTGIMGVTAGAYGAVKSAAMYSSRFNAAAGITGFYDPTTLQSGRIIEAVYGSYKSHPERWENEASAISLADKLADVHVFLYHGTRNDSFNAGQSRMMAIRLRSLQRTAAEGSFNVTYRENKNGYQGWTYWKRHIPEIMEFMNQNLKI